MKELYLAWQDPESRAWTPVGQLRLLNGSYQFRYTKGAKESKNFIPFGQMQKLDVVYQSEELFPLFSNRLLSKSRPEYKSLLQWVNLKEDEADPLALLARTEGIRETDSLTVYPCPVLKEGKYHIHFFSHGIRYLGKDALKLVNSLGTGAQLYLMPDPQNPHDKCAIVIKTGDPATKVGYCPRYLTSDFLRLLNESGPDSIIVEVEKVNLDAPTQFRLLCSMTTEWPQGFRPCSSELYEAISEY